MISAEIISEGFVVLSLQLLRRPVSGVRRVAAHPQLPYCTYGFFISPLLIVNC